jgi:NADPH:quinone reductase
MKAVLCTAFGPLEHLAIREIESPRPGPHQVLIDVKAASLNFPDAWMAQIANGRLGNNRQ